MSQTNRSLLLQILALTLLILPLALGGCKKKDDPNVTYDSQSSGEGDQSGKPGFSESDLGDGSGKGGKGGGGSIAGINTVYFDYDSAALSPQARKAIEGNSQKLKGNKSQSVTVEGHADDRGSTEYNLALGERRANSVRDYLVNLGVQKSRLKTISFGEERPAVVGQDESSWSKNRRAEFVAGN